MRATLPSLIDRITYTMMTAVISVCVCLLSAQISIEGTVMASIEASGMNSADKDVRFLVLSDWGKGGNSGYTWSSKSEQNNNITKQTDDEISNIVIESNDKGIQSNEKSTNQATVAAAMSNYADTFEPSFVIAAGDNFYTLGVSSTTDSNWKDLWSDVYLSYTSLQIPWYAVFGNHDYGYGSTGTEAQIAMTDESEYWSFPDYCYMKTFPFQGGQIGIVFTDTVTLAPDVNSVSSSAENKEEIRSNQLVQVDTMLSKLSKMNEVSWLLVVGHYPIYTGGTHGDTTDLVNGLLPLLLKYKVDAYFCGHDHSSEHLLTKDKSGHELHFFVAGAGAMLDKYGNGNKFTQWHMEDTNAFASVIADQSSLVVSYITSNGDPVYSVTLNHHLKVYQQVFIGVGALIGVFVLLALVFALALPSYRKRIKENLGLRPVISANRQGRNTMTTGSRGRNTMTTGSRQYLNIASPNENETYSITVNPANLDTSNKDNKVHGMTTKIINRIKENLGLRPVISANRQGRNTMTTGSRGRNTMTTGSRQYLNIASPNENETYSITVNPENFDASNTKDSKVHGMTTNVKKVIIKKNKKKMTSKYDAVYVKGKLVEKIGMPLTISRDNITLNSIT